jgi:hypothetical protein
VAILRLPEWKNVFVGFEEEGWLTDRDLSRFVNAYKYGLEVYERAKRNLIAAREIALIEGRYGIVIED